MSDLSVLPITHDDGCDFYVRGHEDFAEIPQVKSLRDYLHTSYVHIMREGQRIYMEQSSMYIATTSWMNVGRSV